MSIRSSLLISAATLCVWASTVVADSFPYPVAADFSAKSWVRAFDALHAKLSAEYAFTNWKDVDWRELQRRYRPQIAKAQRAHDAAAYQLAIREYVFSVPDGHLLVLTPEITEQLAGRRSAAFGFTLARLESGKIIANYIRPNSPADRAGMNAGAVMLSWNGRPIVHALNRVPLTEKLGNAPVATREGALLVKLKFLPRSAPGNPARIRFRNPGARTIAVRRMRAESDNFAMLSTSDFLYSMPLDSPTVTYALLPSGAAFISVRAEVDIENWKNGFLDPRLLYTKVRDEFATLITKAYTDGAKGIILDLRGNHGGGDELAAMLAGFFHTTRSFYERQSYYNTGLKRYVSHTINDSGEPVDALYIEPQSPYFDRPVIALVNPSTLSSGEGVAMGIRRAPLGLVLGFYGTNGSFGMVGDGAELPLGVEVGFPFGRSLDARGRVQLDSRNGMGGVRPNKRIPLNMSNALRFGQGIDVELKAAEECLADFEGCKKSASS